MSHMNNVYGPLQIFTMNIDGTNIRQLTHDGNNGDPVWSPDGTQISFGSDREGNEKLNIFVMNADGSNVRQLTHFDVPIEAGDTHWSPDGTKIIFERDIDGNKQSNPDAYAEVWIMNADGTKQLSTKQPCSCVGCAPRWRPN
jgi:TolB protein